MRGLAGGLKLISIEIEESGMETGNVGNLTNEIGGEDIIFGFVSIMKL
jgi:hypothetical protein